MILENLNKSLSGEPKFRLKQAKQAIFVDLADNWDQATTLSLVLREKLNKDCPLDIKSEISQSRDSQSFKALIYLADGLKIETVLLCHADGRQTVCLSSQVGCALGCSFCATGKAGFKRNLSAGEIVKQVLLWARFLKVKNQRVGNLVFMGMGEPFLNYENVLAAIRIINDQDGLNIGARHISLSTVGVAGGLKKLAKEKLQLNLALSLHAADNELRSSMIPYNLVNPLRNLMKEVNYYLEQTGRRLMVEYLMIDGLNDSQEQALELAEMLNKIEPPLFFVNLIAYNPTAEFKPSSFENIKKFKLVLNKQGIDVTERYRFGRDIDAACGQLAGKQVGDD